MKKRITPAQRKHQDYLRLKGLKVGQTYMQRLVGLRRREVKRVLALCRDVNDPLQWRGIIDNNLSEGYLFDWFKGLYLNAGLPQASSVTRDLTRSKAFSPTSVFEVTLADFAEKRAGRNIVLLSETLKDDLKSLLVKELTGDPNIGIEKLTQNIFSEWAGNLNLWQCRRIAQTETMIGLAEAGDIAAKELDIRYTKEWCISGVGNTRETHEAMDGVVIDENDIFVVGGSSMLYPHDTSLGAPAGEIINCACSCIRIPK